MSDYGFDRDGRFVLDGYDRAKPFASFLPGIAGVMGIPVWALYVNRGQAIASFGVESKDNPIMEFLPANKAYQNTPYVGFRTFLKLARAGETALYEPFSPWESGDAPRMTVGMNELELQTTSAAHGIRTEVCYFGLPGESFAGLVRQVTVTNVGHTPVGLEMLDGMARVMPYGVDNWGLKEIGRTIEAWMEVFNLEQNACPEPVERVPFYRLRASAGDTTQVDEIQAGHFYLAFTEENGQARLLPAFVDPVTVFGHNTAMNAPDRFVERSLAELQAERQITTGRTPCGLFGLSVTLEAAQTVTLYAIVGHTGDLAHLHQHQERITQATYVCQKRDEARQLARQLTDVVDTRTGAPIFDAYCRQTFLDNVLRGGWPLILGGDAQPFVYHVYSRKHGDLERDYNAFYVAAEPYSQGNGNYRDVNQNRRCDVLLDPRVGDFNVRAFLGLIQTDGYNPLVVNGSRFTLAPENRASVLALVEQPHKLESALAHPFTPGQLLKTITERQIGLSVAPQAFVAAALAHAEQHFEASFGEGYWIDHWFYNLDLIETYLAVYPERKDELLFGKTDVPFFDSPAVVQARAIKYVLAGDQVRQYGAVLEDEEKAALIESRAAAPNLMRTERGQGEVYYSTVFAKLVGLALVKFATLDPAGMGIEMEAGKPGWYDALNGLPGLFGSSLCETFELERLLSFLLDALIERGSRAICLPVEQHAFLRELERALAAWAASISTEGDFVYWDTVAAARETYRQRTRLGLDGRTVALACDELAIALASFRARAQVGIQCATDLNDGIPPTYFAYTVSDYDTITGDDGKALRDECGRPYVTPKHFEQTVLPLFLEGPVHALQAEPDTDSARSLYERVKESDLFDRKLKMYKVNAPLAGQSHEIGRARAFTPGWLENESIWLHMEYKYLLQVLKAGLYEEFYADFEHALVPFLDPETYGRSPLENSSFIVSSAHPDESLHGSGFTARLSGSSAEFLDIWRVMMAGQRPFFVADGQLCLALKPALPGWLFDDKGTVTFTFLGHTRVTYHNPAKVDTFRDGAQVRRMVLHPRDGQEIEFERGIIDPPYAEMVRAGQVDGIDVFFA